jgi:hypothetical protein
VPENPVPLPDFTRWPSFPFEGELRVKDLAEPVDVEPPRSGEDAADCVACNTPDEAYIWVGERWRVRAMDRPTGLPMVLILECRSHLDLGDLPNLLAAELGVMTVRLERAVRSLDGVARVHVNRWGDGSAHLHMWFLARPYGRLQLRGTFLSLWDDILPVIPEPQWRQNLAHVAAWLGEFGGRPIAEPPHIAWQSPSTVSESNRSNANLGGTVQPPVGEADDSGSRPLAAIDPSVDAPRPTEAQSATWDSAQTSLHSAAPDHLPLPDAEPARPTPGAADSDQVGTQHQTGSQSLSDGPPETSDGMGNAPTKDLSASARTAIAGPLAPTGAPPTIRRSTLSQPSNAPQTSVVGTPSSPPAGTQTGSGGRTGAGTRTGAGGRTGVWADPRFGADSATGSANFPHQAPEDSGDPDIPPPDAAPADSGTPADDIDRLVGERTTVAYPLRPTTPPRPEGAP